MITIGITGGIGSGKSVVSRILLTLRIPVYDSDSRAKWLNDHSPVVRQALTGLIGSDLYENGILRRDRLAAAIFSSGDLLEQVNEIIHPEVKKDFCQWRSECESDLCAIESAILFSSGFNSLCDTVIRVDAPEKIRQERAMARDGSSAETMRQRMLSQEREQSLAKAEADHTVLNAPPHLLVPQVVRIIETVRTKRPNPPDRL